MQTTSKYKDDQYIHKTTEQYFKMPEIKLYSCRNSEQIKFQKQFRVSRIFFLTICHLNMWRLNTNWILKTRCWREYLETRENCMIRVFIICTLQAILLQLPNKGWAQLITARCAPRINKTEHIKTFWSQGHYIKILAGCQMVLKIHK